MTAKQLLKAKYRTQIFSGKKLLNICQRIERGEINQSSKYIQVFDKNEFYPYEADVMLFTTGNAICYLFKI